jgi:tetratricopeptide (TPR) repeat protein
VLRLTARLSRSLLACLLAAATLVAQATPPAVPAVPAAPTLEPGPAAADFVAHGLELLDLEDPVGAWEAFRRAAREGADPHTCLVGLGRTHLMLGQSAFAVAYAEASLKHDPNSQDAMALRIRSLIRARRFDDAVASASRFLLRVAEPNAELQAARASSLFRVQRIDDAAVGYRKVVAKDPLHAEGHLRLGSGLLPPCVVVCEPQLARAVHDLAAGERDRAIELLRAVLAEAPDHPIAHRLLGETLFAQKAATSMAATDPVFMALAVALPRPEVRGLPIAQFVPGYAKLSPARRAIVDRTAAMVQKQQPKQIALGGRHDLLQELERTTDAEARANLRGKRTFDGRVWDDVRGVGGVQAATGIEALDDAVAFGFDTLAHEVAHQVHYYTFTPLQRARIRALYDLAVLEGRCLDYYAASNEAEYFGQGVEAFASFGKRPGGETTHGHTRFELLRTDTDLHRFLESVVDHDPLALPVVRERVLEAAVAVALRCGRAADAKVAAGLMAPSATRDRLVAEAERALASVRCH